MIKIFWLSIAAVFMTLLVINLKSLISNIKRNAKLSITSDLKILNMNRLIHDIELFYTNYYLYVDIDKYNNRIIVSFIMSDENLKYEILYRDKTHFYKDFINDMYQNIPKLKSIHRQSKLNEILKK